MFKQPVKYIIRNGHAVIFSAAIIHKEMTGYQNKIDSAGFISFDVRQDEYGNQIPYAKVYGRSDSLDIDSRPEDAEIINRQIFNR